MSRDNKGRSRRPFDAALFISFVFLLEILILSNAYAETSTPPPEPPRDYVSAYSSRFGEDFHIMPVALGGNFFAASQSPAVLRRFVNCGPYGTVSVSPTDTQIIFRAEAEFEVVINYYSQLLFSDVFTAPKVESWRALYLDLETYPAPFYTHTHSYYYVNWDNYLFSARPGVVPMKGEGVSLNLDYAGPLREKTEFGNKTISFKVSPPEIVWRSMVVNETRYGALAKYNNQYEAAHQSASLTAMDLRKDNFQATTALAGDVSPDVLQGTITGLGIGATLGKIYNATTATTPGCQQGVISPPARGSVVYLRNKPGSTTSAAGTVLMTIQPAISIQKQSVDVMQGVVVVDIEDGAIIKDAGVKAATATKIPHTRTVSGRVDNAWIQVHLLIRADLYTTVQMDDIPVEKRQILLETPQFIAGDMAWDIGLTGNTQVSFGITSKGDVWENSWDNAANFFLKYILPVLIVLAVAAAIVIIIKISLSRKLASGAAGLVGI